MMRRLVTVAVASIALTPVTAAHAAAYVPISGAGSTWSQNALDDWRANVDQYGMRVNYQGTGSSDGRNQFKNGTVDFAVSEIPYGLKENGVNDTPPARKYAYLPIVAGGTSFMYNLKIAGKRVTNLRLSGENVTKIFTGVIRTWNDPAIARDNPGITLPARKVVPVVRSDGSGTTAQFTLWMSKQHQGLWAAYCHRAGINANPCGLTSTYPVISGSGFVAQSGSNNVSGYVAQSQSEGAITYVEYSYANNVHFPVAKVLNRSGYYVEPTASNVAVALLKAQINNDPSSPMYLTQILDGVYNNADDRTYPLSSYSYMVVPTAAEYSFSTDKGRTLGAFAYYFLCEGQQQAPILGYSPLPINLVQAGLSQVKRIPGVQVETIDIKKCHNPTFSSDGTNTLAKKAPHPPACDKQGATSQCSTGTGGARTPTAVRTVNGSGTATGTTGGAASGSGGALVPGATQSGTAPGTTTVVDPDTGQPVTQQLVDVDAVAVPQTLTAAFGSGSDRVLMGLAVLLLLGVSVGPPLYSRFLSSRTAR